MNSSNFYISLEEALQTFKTMGLLKMKGVKIVSEDGVSQEFKNASQKANYHALYQTAIDNFDFDVLLADDSFLQFSFSENANSQVPTIRYAYFQNPKYYTSYQTYLELLRKDGVIALETDEEVGDTFREEHEQFLIEAQLNQNCTSMRYETDIKNYQPQIHSVAHMHIGNFSEVRLPCDKIITPLKFSLFILRHVYYDFWKQAIQLKQESLLASLQRTKADCFGLEKDFWAESEKQELFLT